MTRVKVRVKISGSRLCAADSGNDTGALLRLRSNNPADAQYTAPDRTDTMPDISSDILLHMLWTNDRVEFQVAKVARHTPYVRLLLVASVMPRKSRNRPITVSWATMDRSDTGLLVALLDAARPSSTCAAPNGAVC